VLKKGQRADGGFGKEQSKTSDLETSYRVMRAFVMLKDKPDVERCRSFVAQCRNPDRGYGVAPGQTSSVAATYFASIILHWLIE
jgi:prenyltransferase beta subunit